MHNKQYLLTLIIAGTILGLAGTDLVLPAVPTLPEYINGTLSQAQLVLAAFTGGTAIGLLVFGELGARYDKKLLLLGTLAAYSITSFLCSFSGLFWNLWATVSYKGSSLQPLPCLLPVLSDFFLMTEARCARSV